LKTEIIIHEQLGFSIPLTVTDDGYCFCPVCGYKSNNKSWRPYNTKGYPSYDICKCGFEYGYDCGPDGPLENDWAHYRLKWLSGELDYGDSKRLCKKDKILRLRNIGIEVTE
tara:strand:+ start:57 stop:392 length:336 start_codon:yes stop_codon:yes gene_type:complete